MKKANKVLREFVKTRKANMWQVILQALIKELETDPSRVFTILESIISLFKANPNALAEAAKAFRKPE